MVLGNIIFPFEACGILKKYVKNESESNPHIIFAKELTIDVAFYILNNPVCGIITESSSFATHGANILRCKIGKSINNLSWISGVNYCDIETWFGKKIIMTANGTISVLVNESHININNDIKKPSIISYIPIKKRSIVSYDICNNSYSICYWPHRNFNNLTFSVMKIGLIHNFELLGKKQVNIILDNKGNIWFENSYFISEIVDIAKNRTLAMPILTKQIQLYENIYNKLLYNFTPIDLINMLTEYFSLFVLFHDTYEDVLIEADKFFKEHLESDISYKAMDLLMHSWLDEWMADNNIILEKRKNLLSYEEVVSLPQYSILYDINYCIKRFSDFLVKSDYSDFLKKFTSKITFYIQFFVAKEWKFVINKILFTRFSDMLRCELPQYTFSEFAIMSIQDVIGLLKEKGY